MMHLLITLIIPTHNRHHYLNRILDYLKSQTFQIIIADSTEQFYSSNTLSSNYNYLHLPGKTLTQKLSIALHLVQTEYVLMCADDDFLIPQGVIDCVNFL